MRIALLLAGLNLAGCGTTVSYTHLNSPPAPMHSRSQDQVAVLSATPARPFVEVGMFEARQSSQYSMDEMGDVIQEMRREAARVGCDALLMRGSADEVVGSGSTSSGTGFMGVSTLKGYRAVCVVYTGEAVAVSPAPAPAAPERACVPNETKLCHGPGACKGAQACNADGTGYTPCDCAGGDGAQASTDEPASDT